MNTRNSKFAKFGVLVLLLAMTFTLAACSDDDGGGSVTIKDVEELSAVEVSYNTSGDDAITNLPETVKVTLSNNDVKEPTVAWEVPEDYSATTPGTYTFTGKYQISDVDDLKGQTNEVTVDVTVKEEQVTELTVDSVSAVNETISEGADYQLPDTVTAEIKENDETVELNVNWNGEVNVYDVGEQTFEGELVEKEGYVIPEDAKAEATITVELNPDNYVADEEGVIAYLGIDANAVTENFDLPQEMVFSEKQYDVKSWEVVEGDAIEINDSQAIVTRPKAGEEDANVSLTATLDYRGPEAQADHANEVTVNLTVPAELPVDPQLDGEVTATDVKVGDTLADSDLSGSFVDPETEEAVEGTLEWTDATQTVNETAEFEWTFTPNNTDKYNEIKNTVEVSIPTNAVNVVGNENVTVTTTPAEEAKEGAEVTVSVDVTEGYLFDAINVTKAEDAAVETTEVTANEEYTFVMPESDVDVDVTVTEDPSYVATAEGFQNALDDDTIETITVTDNITGDFTVTRDLTIEGNDNNLDGTLTVDGDITVNINNLNITEGIIENAASETVNFKGGSVDTLTNNKADVTINIDGTTIKTATFNAATTVTGASNIEKAVVKDNGVEMDEEPQSVDTENSEYDSYIAKVESVTDFENKTVIQAIDSPDLSYKVYDQYGKELTTEISNYNDNLKVEVRIDGVLVPSDKVTGNVANELFNLEISESLDLNEPMSVKFVNEDADGNELMNVEFSYNFEEEPALSTLELTADSAKLETGSLNEVVTAKFKDQYGNIYNDFTNLGTDDVVRYEITEGYEDVITFSNSSEAVRDADDTVEIDAEGKGTAKITAVFIPNDTEQDKVFAEQSIEIKVVDGVVDTINDSAADLTVTNKASVSEANIAVNDSEATKNIEFKNENDVTIPAIAEDVSFDVVDSNGDDASDVVNIEKVVENGYVTGLIVTTDRSDQKTQALDGNPDETYTVTAKVGEVESAGFDVTSSIDKAVETISLTSLKANELTVGSTDVEQTVTFKNQYGEFVDINTGDVETVVSGDTTVNSVNRTVEDGVVSFALNYNVPETTTTGTKSGTIVVGEASSDYELEVVASSAVKTINIANSAEVIKADSFNDEDDSTIFHNGSKAYKVVDISFTDQYGNPITVTAGNNSKLGDNFVISENSNVEEVLLKETESGLDEVDSSGDEVVAVGLYAKNTASSLETVSIDVIESLRAENYEAGAAELSITVNAERAADDLTIDPTSLSMAPGVNDDITVNVVDQYGDPIDTGSEGAITVTSLDTSVATLSGSESTTIDSDSSGESTVQVDAETAGTTDVEFKMTDVDGNEVKKTLEVTVTDNLDIAKVELQPLDSDDEEMSLKDLYFVDDDSADADEQKLKVVGYDSNNNKVTIGDDDIYKFEVIELEDADGNDMSATEDWGDWIPTLNSVEETIDFNSSKIDASGHAVVRVVTNSGNSDTVRLDFSNKDPNAQAGTVEFYTDAKMTQSVTDPFEINESAILYLDGVDQYGNKLSDYTTSYNKVKDVNTSDSNVVSIDHNNDNEVDLTPVSPGTARITIFYDEEGTEQIRTIDVEVTSAVTANISAPEDGAFISGDQTFSGTAKGDAFDSYTLEDDEGTSIVSSNSTSVDNSDFVSNYDTANLTDGERTITLTVTDDNSITTTDSITVTVDNTDPTATLTSPTNGSPVYVQSGTDVTVDYNATDTNFDSATLVVDGAKEIYNNTVTKGDNDVTVDTTDAAEGDYNISLDVVDSAGNSASASESVAIVVDDTAPTVTSNLTGSGSGLTISASGSETLTFSENLNSSSQSAIETAISNSKTGSGTLNMNWTNDSTLEISENDGSSSITIASSGDVTADITDVAGNTTTSATLVTQ